MRSKYFAAVYMKCCGILWWCFSCCSCWHNLQMVFCSSLIFLDSVKDRSYLQFTMQNIFSVQISWDTSPIIILNKLTMYWIVTHTHSQKQPNEVEWYLVSIPHPYIAWDGVQGLSCKLYQVLIKYLRVVTTLAVSENTWSLLL